MANVFFTADTHLGHGNIVRYARRPELRPGDVDSLGQWVSHEVCLKRAEQMNARLTALWNSRVKPGDTVYHLGDFCCKGNEKGVPGGKTKAETWLAGLNGNIIFVLGNHDRNNGLPRGLEYAVMLAGNMRLLLLHNPEKRPQGIFDAVVHGHVHTAWKEQMRDVPYVNVGVDARAYLPVKLDELIGLVNKVRRQHNEEGEFKVG